MLGKGCSLSHSKSAVEFCTAPNEVFTASFCFYALPSHSYNHLDCRPRQVQELPSWSAPKLTKQQCASSVKQPAPGELRTVAFGDLGYVKMKYPTNADSKLLAVQQAPPRFPALLLTSCRESPEEQASLGSRNILIGFVWGLSRVGRADSVAGVASQRGFCGMAFLVPPLQIYFLHSIMESCMWQWT